MTISYLQTWPVPNTLPCRRPGEVHVWIRRSMSHRRPCGSWTRDPRMKERKKYGLKRARKAPQYTKR